MFVKRPLLESFLLAGGRRLLYGRRKTGKTFYARAVLPDHQYFIVMRGGLIYDPGSDTVLDTGAFLRLCRSVDKVVLDEFHRADPKVFYAVQAGECAGDPVFITSTLHYFTRFVTSPGAPLKGMFRQMRVGLISPVDLLAAGWGFSGPELVERVLLYVEPPMVGLDTGSVVMSSLDYSNSLVGEVLSEEDVALTNRFIAIMEAIAAGRTKPTQISGYLSGRGLLPKDSASLISKYLKLMVDVGLLERIPVYGSKRGSVYRHASPVTEIAYYLSARYGFGEVPLSREFVMRVFRERLPLLVERFVERLLSDALGLRPVKIVRPEVDIALTRFRKLSFVAEVKWKRRVSKEEVRKAEEKMFSLREPERRVLIVPEESAAPETGLEVWDAQKLVELAKEAFRKRTM